MNPNAPKVTRDNLHTFKTFRLVRRMIGTEVRVDTLWKLHEDDGTLIPYFVPVYSTYPENDFVAIHLDNLRGEEPAETSKPSTLFPSAITVEIEVKRTETVEVDTSQLRYLVVQGSLAVAAFEYYRQAADFAGGCYYGDVKIIDLTTGKAAV